METGLDDRKKRAEIAKLEVETAKLANEQRWCWSAVRGVKVTEWATTRPHWVRVGKTAIGMVLAIRDLRASVLRSAGFLLLPRGRRTLQARNSVPLGRPVR